MFGPLDTALTATSGRNEVAVATIQMYWNELDPSRQFLIGAREIDLSTAKLMTSFSNLGPKMAEVDAIARTLPGHFNETGSAGAAAFEQIVRAIGGNELLKLPEVQAAMERVRGGSLTLGEALGGLSAIGSDLETQMGRVGRFTLPGISGEFVQVGNSVAFVGNEYLKYTDNATGAATQTGALATAVFNTDGSLKQLIPSTELAGTKLLGLGAFSEAAVFRLGDIQEALINTNNVMGNFGAQSVSRLTTLQNMFVNLGNAVVGQAGRILQALHDTDATLGRFGANAVSRLNTVAGLFVKIGSQASSGLRSVEQALHNADSTMGRFGANSVSRINTVIQRVAALRSAITSIPTARTIIVNQGGNALSALQQTNNWLNRINGRRTTSTHVHTHTTIYRTIGTRSFQKGFEGVVSGAMNMTVGEAGPELVQVIPLQGKNAANWNKQHG